MVKRWRELHLSGSPSNNNKRMSLTAAAREVGVNRKTLEDYYCLLRLAELYHFDFSQQ